MRFTIDSLPLVVVLLCLVISMPYHGYSQRQITIPVNAYNHTLTTENGLSENNVSCVIKDADGFVWIGTGNGLNRFDGYSFVHYHHSDNDTLSISHNAIQNMLLDSKGRLWVGTFHGLNLYDSKKETFQKFLIPAKDAKEIDNSTILGLLEDSSHQLWVGTYGDIYKIDLETFSIKKYNYEDDRDNTGLGVIKALIEDRNGKIWASTDKGICIMSQTGIERMMRPGAGPGSLPADVIVSMTQHKTGAMYFGTNGSGVLRLDDENDQTFERFTPQHGEPFFGTDIIGALTIDKNGKLLVGTDGAGIYKQDSAQIFRQILGSQSRLLHKGNIVDIFVDERNTYWLSLYGGGVHVVYENSMRFEHYRYFDIDMERTGKNSVLAIAEDQQKKIWIGTDGAGLYKFDPQSKSFTLFRHSPTNKNSISSDVVKSLLIDENNNVYAGTFGGGLNYLDTKTQSVTRYMHVPGNAASIGTNHVWSLLQDHNRRVYVGQLAGLDEFVPELRAFKAIRIAGLKHAPPIFSMQEDRNGNVWIGTRLDGLYRYNPDTKTFTPVLNIPGDSTSMPSNEIVDLGLSSQGKLWIATGNKGLILFDPESFRYTRVGTGLDERFVSNVLEDNSNNVWLTSTDGVQKFNLSTLRTYAYTMTDGLQGTHFNEGASLRSADGTFYLGGTNGLNVFRPERILDDTTNAKIVFTQLRLFNVPVDVDDKSKLLSASISHTESITFQPDQNVFSIEFACLEFNFPKTNKYRYYLEGFDKDWNDANASRTATYTNLPAGEYTLKVSASRGSGQGKENAASIRIIVIPRWYERLDIQSVLVILLILVTILIIHFRTKLLLRQKLKLEQLVRARTNLVETQKLEIKDKNRKLEQAYEEVHSTNEALQRVNLNLEKLIEDRTAELRLTIKKLIETDKGLDTFLYRSSHDLRGPIVTIQGLARLGKMQQNSDDLNLYFTNIEKTSDRMLRLLKRLNETSALFRAQRVFEVIDVDRMIDTIRTSLKELNPNDGVKVEFENKIGPVFTGDQALIKCIIVNLMENSIVFGNTNNPYVKCMLSIERQRLLISVIDNGSGIRSSDIDHISTMFYRGSEKSNGNGLGLFMVKKALEVLGGEMKIDSEPNVMTTFTVIIPL